MPDGGVRSGWEWPGSHRIRFGGRADFTGGDSQYDVMIAKNAGVDCAFLEYGYADRKLIKKLRPEFVLSGFRLLKELIWKRSDSGYYYIKYVFDHYNVVLDTIFKVIEKALFQWNSGHPVGNTTKINKMPYKYGYILKCRMWVSCGLHMRIGP